jgi:hypothetical protein
MRQLEDARTGGKPAGYGKVHAAIAASARARTAGRFWWPPSRRNEAGQEHGALSGVPANTRTRQLIVVARAIVTCGPAPTRAGTAPKRRRRATAAVDSFSPLSDGGSFFRRK